LPTGMATGANGFAPNVAGYQGMFPSLPSPVSSNDFNRPIRRRTRSSTASPRIRYARHPNGSTPTHGYANLSACDSHGRPVWCRSATATCRNDADAGHGDPTRVSTSASVRYAAATDDGNADDGRCSASSSGVRRKCGPDAAEMMNRAQRRIKLVRYCGYVRLLPLL
jgi:hypothetical protein